MSAALELLVANAGDVEFLAQVVLETHEARYAVKPGWDRNAFFQGLVEDATEQVDGLVAYSTTYVIVDGGERVGRLRLVRTSEYVEIAGIQLLPSVQNRGIGTLIVRRVIDEAMHRQRPLELDVESDNPDARRLYERLGFCATAFEDDEPSDRVRMIYRPREDG